MTMRVVRTAALVLLVCGVGTAHAQSNRRVGLTMGYPAAIGVLWHVSDRIAIRPEIDFSRVAVTSETTSTVFPGIGDEVTSRIVKPAVSALIYLARRDELRTYVTPRFAYSSSDTSQSDQSSSTYFVSGSFGAQQQVGGQFAVFGELGLEYTRGTTRLSATTLSITSRRSGIASRAGVGVALYF